MTVTANGLQARYSDQSKLDLPTITASARYRFHISYYAFGAVGLVELAGLDMKYMQLQSVIMFGQTQYYCLTTLREGVSA